MNIITKLAGLPISHYAGGGRGEEQPSTQKQQLITNFVAARCLAENVDNSNISSVASAHNDSCSSKLIDELPVCRPLFQNTAKNGLNRLNQEHVIIHDKSCSSNQDSAQNPVIVQKSGNFNSNPFRANPFKKLVTTFDSPSNNGGEFKVRYSAGPELRAALSQLDEDSMPILSKLPNSSQLQSSRQLPHFSQLPPPPKYVSKQDDAKNVVSDKDESRNIPDNTITNHNSNHTHIHIHEQKNNINSSNHQTSNQNELNSGNIFDATHFEPSNTAISTQVIPPSNINGINMINSINVKSKVLNSKNTMHHFHHHTHVHQFPLRSNSLRANITTEQRARLCISHPNNRRHTADYDYSSSDDEQLVVQNQEFPHNMLPTPPKPKGKKSVAQLKRRSSYHTSNDLPENVKFKNPSLQNQENLVPVNQSLKFAKKVKTTPTRPRNLSLKLKVKEKTTEQENDEVGELESSKNSAVKRRSKSINSDQRQKHRNSYLLATAQENLLVQNTNSPKHSSRMKFKDLLYTSPTSNSRNVILEETGSQPSTPTSANRSSTTNAGFSGLSPKTAVPDSNDVNFNNFHISELSEALFNSNSNSPIRMANKPLSPGSYLNDTTHKIGTVLNYKCKFISKSRIQDLQKNGYKPPSNRKLKSKEWKDVYLVLRYDRKLYLEDVANCKVANYCELLADMLKIGSSEVKMAENKSFKAGDKLNTQNNKIKSEVPAKNEEIGKSELLPKPDINSPSVKKPVEKTVSSQGSTMMSSKLYMFEPPLDLALSLVDMNYKQKSRKHVFQVTSKDGSEYLFQAKTHECCFNWIQLIRENNNPDENSTDTYVNMTLIKQKAEQNSKR